MAESLMTPVARLCFPSLDKARVPKGANADAKAKFSACLLFDPSQFTPKDKARYKAMRQAALDALREKFGSKAFDDKGKPKAGFDWPFNDAALKADKYKGFEEGMVYVNAKTEIQPGIADARDGKDSSGKWPEAEDASDAYPGCFVRGKVQFFAYDNMRKGVGIGLGNVIIMKDGERMDGGVEAGNDFDDIDDDELYGSEEDGGDDGDDDMI